MNSQEAILLKMAQKLKSCDEQEMRELCSQSPATGQDSDEIYQTLDRWSRLEPATQQKILSLMKSGDVHAEVNKLKTHITQLMQTQKERLGKEKGQ